MKKYLIPSTLLAVAAMAAPAFADDSLLPSLVDESGSSTVTRLTGSYSDWSQNIGVPGSISADVVKACYGTGVFSETGWYWGLANLQDAQSSDFSVNDDGTGFTFDGRYRYNGEFVASIVYLEDILSDDEGLSSFSLSFTYSGDTSVSFSVYCIDLSGGDSSVTQLYFTQDSGTIICNWTADSDDYLTGDYALMFIWNDNSQGNVATVSDLTSSYTPVTIPEPSMFGLFFGLGAIGLVATRRRRR